VQWVGGAVNYYVDLSSLNSRISHQQATALRDAARAGVILTHAASLNEDVNGANVIAGN
jgi:hypothetical protein